MEAELNSSPRSHEVTKKKSLNIIIFMTLWIGCSVYQHVLKNIYFFLVLNLPIRNALHEYSNYSAGLSKKPYLPNCHFRECGGYPLGHPECKSAYCISNLTPSILFGQPRGSFYEYDTVSERNGIVSFFNFVKNIRIRYVQRTLKICF